MGKTKKEKAFELFDQGFDVSSPEIKALKLKSGTRHNYHSEWLHHDPRSANEQGLGKKVKEARLKAKAKDDEGAPPLVIDETRQPAQSNADWLEDGVEQHFGPDEKPVRPEPAPRRPIMSEGLDVEDEEEKEPEESKPAAPHSEIRPKKKLNEILSSISSEGIPMKVFLSIKTLNLYEIAKSLARANDGNGNGHGEQEVELSLGDFLDMAVEDYFVGRGYDLGLIQLEDEKEAVNGQ